jgi:hypothetical protein
MKRSPYHTWLILRTHAGSRRSMYVDVCWRMLTYADVCWRMLTYADVCLGMLRYADVCWGMLTYADVCWRMQEADGWCRFSFAWGGRNNGWWCQYCRRARLLWLGRLFIYSMLTYADVCWRMLTYANIVVVHGSFDWVDCLYIYV